MATQGDWSKLVRRHPCHETDGKNVASFIERFALHIARVADKKPRLPWIITQSRGPAKTLYCIFRELSVLNIVLASSY